MTVRELEVITRLEALNGNKHAIDNLPDRIAMLENRAYTISAVSTDSERVSGGDNRVEDQRIENMMERAIAAADLEYAKAEVKQLEKALGQVTENERKVLDKFYINKSKNAVRALCAELGYEEAQIYRIRKAAINDIALILYGSRRK